MRSRALLTLVFCLAAITAEGHTRSESYSTWRINGTDVFARISVPGLEATRLPEVENGTRSLSAILSDEVKNSTRVVDSLGDTCSLESLQPVAAAGGILQLELSFACAAAPARILYAALFEVAPSHIHYARIFAGDQLLAETLLRADRVGIELATDAADTNYQFADFFRLGVDHILSGFDHIAFLIGLLLVAGTMKRSLVAVTGFTIGHSVSLAAAVLGFVSADARLVEAFIGFTVGLIALEYFLLRDGKSRALSDTTGLFAAVVGMGAFALGAVSGHELFAYFGLALFAWCYLRAAALLDEGLAATGRSGLVLLIATFCFGLIHGFGFAGFLVDTGLLGNELFAPLLGFNLGVEIGQLLLIAVTVAVAYPVRRLLPPVLPELVAACVCGLGVFWFVSRSFA